MRGFLRFWRLADPSEAFKVETMDCLLQLLLGWSKGSMLRLTALGFQSLARFRPKNLLRTYQIHQNLKIAEDICVLACL